MVEPGGVSRSLYVLSLRHGPQIRHALRPAVNAAEPAYLA